MKLLDFQIVFSKSKYKNYDRLNIYIDKYVVL